MPKIDINLSGWQDYRGMEAGSLLYVETSHESAVPVRDQLNENGKGFLYEPNYETSTYGFMSCYNVKNVNTIVKAKSRYILFGTRYEGLSEADLRNKYLIHGFMKIEKTFDVRTRHIRKYMLNQTTEEPECMQMEHNIAVYGKMHFVSLADSFVLADELLKEWGHRGHASRQLKTVFKGDQLKQILDHLNSKPEMIDEYIMTVDEYKEALQDEMSEAENS